jgi:hypothetical protein
VLQRFVDDRRQVARIELARGEVDGDRQRVPWTSCPPPAACLVAGGCEHLGAERHDEATVFCDGDERRGGQDRAVGLGDPGERFKAGDTAAGEVDDGLVMDDHAVVVQRRLEHPLGDGALSQLSAEGGVEDFGAPPAERFGSVHGGVSFAEQGLRGRLPAD